MTPSPARGISSLHLTHTIHINWGAANCRERGPFVGTLTDLGRRNTIGTHSDAYSLYRVLAVAAGTLDPVHVPVLTDTAPAASIGPFPQWADSQKIVSLDPYGHLISEVFEEQLHDGDDIRPTIAMTKTRVNMPEVQAAMAHGVEVGIQTAQENGVGIIVYNRKEGRALGEVTKFLVYNARKRQVGGDRAETYFERTECVADVQDMRFQELMPDVIH